MKVFANLSLLALAAGDSPKCAEHKSHSDDSSILDSRKWTSFDAHNASPEAYKGKPETFNLCKRGEGKISHLVVLIHGFGSKPSAWAESMSEKIFEKDSRKNLAILMVDWRDGASNDGWTPAAIVAAYDRAVARTRYVGASTSMFIDRLAGGNPKLQIHCIGHSLGAQTCGFLGKERSAKKIWKISGLDPAGPQFTKVEVDSAIYKYIEKLPSSEQRLGAQDADLVEVWHTDGNQWGSMTPMGDIDLYVGISISTFGTKQKYCKDNGNGDRCDHTQAPVLYEDAIGTQVPGDIQECKKWNEETLTECEAPAEKYQFGYFNKPPAAKAGMFSILQESEIKEDDVWSDDW